MSAPTLLTEQLQRFAEGDRVIAESVLREILPELHRIAVRAVGRERYMSPITPTELINEVWIRSLRKGGWQIKSRAHFYAIAALAMRRVLVDYARERLAQRRGDGNMPASLDEAKHQAVAGQQLIVEMGLLMDRLEIEDPEAARIVDMHYFAGFTLDEIGAIAGLSPRQIRHRWTKGRDWLKDHLGNGLF